MAHTSSVAGTGSTVAVLDTGIDPAIRCCATGRSTVTTTSTTTTDPAEERQQAGHRRGRVPDKSYGHGTFVAGLVGLVAPDAPIMPMRVLDSDGFGNVW